MVCFSPSSIVAKDFRVERIEVATMLTVKKFINCLARSNHADVLFVGIDSKEDKQDRLN